MKKIEVAGYELVGLSLLLVVIGSFLLFSYKVSSNAVPLTGAGVLIVGGAALYYTKKIKKQLQGSILRMTRK